MGFGSTRLREKVPEVTFKGVWQTVCGQSFLLRDRRRVIVVGYQCVRKGECYYYHKDVKQYRLPHVSSLKITKLSFSLENTIF